MSKVVFQPSRWIVNVSVAGQVVSSHECRNMLHARTLISEVRELAQDLSAILPGLNAAGYELAEAVKVVDLPPVPASGRDARWWAQSIGLAVPEE